MTTLTFYTFLNVTFDESTSFSGNGKVAIYGTAIMRGIISQSITLECMGFSDVTIGSNNQLYNVNMTFSSILVRFYSKLVFQKVNINASNLETLLFSSIALFDSVLTLSGTSVVQGLVTSNSSSRLRKV